MTAALITIALLLVAAVIVVLARRRAHVGEQKPLEGVVEHPGPAARGEPLPVVLVHGLFGFDRVGIPGMRLHYFRGIVEHLEGLGCHAHAVRLPGAASVPERAQRLVEAVTALGHERVDIIAHSMGGLDARYAVARLGLASRVRSLVTVGTPHRGSPIADLATGGGPLSIARKALGAIVKLEAVDWLTTEALERFNRDVVDAPGVRYGCVVGAIRNDATPIAPVLMAAHAYLRKVAGANDGLVPLASQYWGETLAEIEADHAAQIGWVFGRKQVFDALGLYAFIVARLGDAPAARLTA